MGQPEKTTLVRGSRKTSREPVEDAFRDMTKRDARLHYWLTDAEHVRAQAAARTLGLSLSSLGRAALLGLALPRPSERPRPIPEMNLASHALLARQANILGQIGARLGEGVGPYDDETSRLELDEALVATVRLVHHVRPILISGDARSNTRVDAERAGAEPEDQHPEGEPPAPVAESSARAGIWRQIVFVTASEAIQLHATATQLCIPVARLVRRELLALPLTMLAVPARSLPEVSRDTYRSLLAATDVLNQMARRLNEDAGEYDSARAILQALDRAVDLLGLLRAEARGQAESTHPSSAALGAR